MVKAIKLKGKKFGRWKVLDRHPVSKHQGYSWWCKCNCGTIKLIRGTNLRNGTSTSCRCTYRLPKGESAFRWLYNYYKKTCAKARGYIFELTLEDFKKITKEKCYYCGTKPKNIIDRSSSNSYGIYLYNGIDRKNNKLGYTKKNSVPCCKICNQMKSNGLSEKEFLNQIRKIYKNKK